MSHVVILSGPSGAGKSAVAESLCERYDRTVHIETDMFFACIRMGHVHPMKPESNRQNIMISRAAARAATAYVQDLFAVFIDGVIGPHLLPLYLEEFRSSVVPVHFVVLRPSLEETLRRVDGRVPRRQLAEDQHRRLYEQFVAYGDFAGITIDNTSMTADQAGDRVMEACGAGECLVLPGR
jgi:chloramphenicol 3-O-phosphotransferase